MKRATFDSGKLKSSLIWFHLNFLLELLMLKKRTAAWKGVFFYVFFFFFLEINGTLLGLHYDFHGKKLHVFKVSNFHLFPSRWKVHLRWWIQDEAWNESAREPSAISHVVCCDCHVTMPANSIGALRPHSASSLYTAASGLLKLTSIRPETGWLILQNKSIDSFPF